MQCSLILSFRVYSYQNLMISTYIPTLIKRACGIKGTRMYSTIICQSGREYMRSKVLQEHPKKAELNVYLAKYVSKLILNPASLARILADSVNE